MGFLARRRVNRLIEGIIGASSADRAELTEALLTLREEAEVAVPQLVAALDRAGPKSAVAVALRALLDDSTLPHYLVGLSHRDPEVVEAVADMLSRAEGLHVERLIELFNDPGVSKEVLSRILGAHHAQLRPGPLLRTLDKIPEEARPAFFRLLEKVVDDASLADLIELLDSGDTGLKLNVMRVLRRFSHHAARDALLGTLDDRHKSVRMAALDALAGLAIEVDPARLCVLLRDPDIAVQARAIEAIAGRNDPGTVAQLIEVLQDESEYIRRAAVEVLNRVGTVDAIKDLIAALEDSDWWVRVRAADALGQIGDSRVVDAVMDLTDDDDTFIRRFAVEILNTNSDPRARDCLERALDDDDWWVRERAVDGLAALGDSSVLPALLRMLEHDQEAAPHILRALARLGDDSVIATVEAQMASSDRATRKEAEQALAVLRGEQSLPARAEPSRDLAISDGRNRSSKSRLEATLTGSESPSSGATLETTATAAPGSVGSSTMVADGNGGPAQSVSGVGYVDLDDLAPGDILADRYRVERRIGRGAFGEVVLVEDQAVSEEIILKFLHRHLTGDPEVIQRFVHELRYTRRITHENVIRIYDFLTLGKSFAMSMEYFASDSLSAILKRGRVARPDGLRYMRDICRGMSAAHLVGVVHRDLKPGNVLINDAGLLKVVDFGLAAATGHMTTRMTRAGVILGTPSYMAPEQIRGEEIDPRTDIYSLGVIMYELFTGRVPYKGDEPMAIMFQHIEGKPKPPSEREPELPEAFEMVILKAMALKPGERFQSIDELDAALAELPDGSA